VQALDLEGLARHRGSLFGALAGQPQPSQKMFESRLLAALDALDLERPIVVEAEASKVGERMVPPALWTAMAGAPRITLFAPPEARARHLAAAYPDVAADLAAFADLLQRLPIRLGRKTLAAWRALAEAGELEALAAELIAAHYDPAYDRADRKDARPRLARVEMPGLAATDLDRAAEAVAAAVAAAQWR
jgi:tRNA 2-selenouridine synthase